MWALGAVLFFQGEKFTAGGKKPQRKEDQKQKKKRRSGAPLQQRGDQSGVFVWEGRDWSAGVRKKNGSLTPKKR